MKTLVIGRGPQADIELKDSSVEPHHAELLVTQDGRYHLTDCGTGGGTWEAGTVEPGPDDWETVRQAFVGARQPLRFGAQVCTLETLLRPLLGDGIGLGAGSGGAGAAQGRAGDRLRGPLERDPRTGEIVRRRR